MVAVEYGHDQTERLAGAEHQRRKPDASAEAVATVAAARRLDGDTGLTQDRDVAAGRPFGHVQSCGEPVGGDAGLVLQQFIDLQRPRSGACVGVHGNRIYQEAERPE